MRLIAWKNLSVYADQHPETKPGLQRWASTVYQGEWSTMAQLTATFSGAKTVSRDRVRFEIAGGNYRLIVAFNLTRQIAFVKFIGTHAEYDRIDAETVEMF